MSDKLKGKIADNRFSKDSIQKDITAGYKKGEELLKYLNLNLGNLVEILPNDSATTIHISRRETDRVFLMEDGSIINLEFQDKYIPRDVHRFFLYCAALYEKYEREVNTVVIYTKTPPKNAVYDFKWKTLYFRVLPIVLSELKSEEILKPILSKMANEPYSELDANDKLALVYSLFMNNRNIEENLKMFYNLIDNKIKNFEVQKGLSIAALLMVAEEAKSEVSEKYAKELIKMMSPENREDQEKLDIITQMINDKKVKELEDKVKKQAAKLNDFLRYKYNMFIKFKKNLNVSEAEALKLAEITPEEYKEIKLLLDESSDSN